LLQGVDKIEERRTIYIVLIISEVCENFMFVNLQSTNRN
jgi:hypothetical protein